MVTQPFVKSLPFASCKCVQLPSWFDAKRKDEVSFVSKGILSRLAPWKPLVTTYSVAAWIPLRKKRCLTNCAEKTLKILLNYFLLLTFFVS